jgi:hypothetical protein
MRHQEFRKIQTKFIFLFFLFIKYNKTKIDYERIERVISKISRFTSKNQNDIFQENR